MKTPKKELVWNIQEFDEVDSTNDLLLDSSRKGAKQGMVIYANSQKKGEEDLEEHGIHQKEMVFIFHIF